MGKKHTAESFIKLAQQKHGNVMDYSLVEYVNNSTKVKLICPKHGIVEQMPNKHLLCSFPCPECGHENGNGLRISYDTFVERLKENHGDKIDISFVDKKNFSYRRKKYKFVCNNHGEFFNRPTVVTNSYYGCPMCGNDGAGNKLRKPKEEFLKEAKEKHGNKYDYSKITKLETKNFITIICKEHGSFKTKMKTHLNNDHGGCPDCKGNVYDANSFIEKAKSIYGDTYNYDNVIYEKSNKHVEIICKEHGSFMQSPNNHLRGKQCPSCLSNRSKNEIYLYERIKKDFPNLDIRNNYRELSEIEGFEIDIAILDLELYIEWNGHYWHSQPMVYNRDNYKKRKLGDKLIQIEDIGSHNEKFVDNIYDTLILPRIKQYI